jgi:hypothetical protein
MCLGATHCCLNVTAQVLPLLLLHSPAWCMGMPSLFPSQVSLMSFSACDPTTRCRDEAAGQAESRDRAWQCCYCCTHQDQLRLILYRARRPQLPHNAENIGFSNVRHDCLLLVELGYSLHVDGRRFP